MAALVVLRSSMAALTITPSSFFGENFLPPLSLPVKIADRCYPIVMKLRGWERKKYKPNGVPILQKVHVKTGDTVQVIAGSDKGKVGEITRVFRHNSKVIVNGVNLKVHFMKSKEPGVLAPLVKIEAPIHSSNVMLYSKVHNVASRVGKKFLEDGTKVRYLIKTGEIIDIPGSWKRVVKGSKKKEAAEEQQHEICT